MEQLQFLPLALLGKTSQTILRSWVVFPLCNGLGITLSDPHSLLAISFELSFVVLTPAFKFHWRNSTIVYFFVHSKWDTDRFLNAACRPILHFWCISHSFNMIYLSFYTETHFSDSVFATLLLEEYSWTSDERNHRQHDIGRHRQKKLIYTGCLIKELASEVVT